MRDLIELRNEMLLKGYCHLRKIWVEIKGRNISKNLSGKCSQKRLDHAKRFVTGALKTALKTTIQKISGSNR